MSWLLALKGPPGCGKSTLAAALSQRLGWPLIDKDDVKDLLDGKAADAGGLAYEIMFNGPLRSARRSSVSVQVGEQVVEGAGVEDVRGLGPAAAGGGDGVAHVAELARRVSIARAG
jgi:energy-coupling factor transporter ATP-binding protein EcfA2